MARESYETHAYDVVVVGAGGAGLRAGIEAHGKGAKTAIICKSLLGKAHTVMAEGGSAAAMGNVWPEDNWKVHFRDTMRGGKLLNNWSRSVISWREMSICASTLQGKDTMRLSRLLEYSTAHISAVYT